jgi:hypothetical protein
MTTDHVWLAIGLFFPALSILAGWQINRNMIALLEGEE